jgi:hypothetical protein
MYQTTQHNVKSQKMVTFMIISTRTPNDALLNVSSQIYATYMMEQIFWNVMGGLTSVMNLEELEGIGHRSMARSHQSLAVPTECELYWTLEPQCIYVSTTLQSSERNTDALWEVTYLIFN